MSYFTGFDLIKIDAKGVSMPQINTEVKVRDVANNTFLDPLDSGDFGVIAGGELPVPAGTYIEFSVDGFDDTLTRTTTATEDYTGITELALILDDEYEATFATVAYNEIWMKSSNQTDPQIVGTVAPGETLKVPYNAAVDNEIQFFAVAKTEKGATDVFGLQNAASVTIAPNRETGTPAFSQNGAAENAKINFLASGYTVAKFRRIRTASDVGMTTNLKTVVQGSLGQNLPPEFSITRETDLDDSETVYVEIAHSTNSDFFDVTSGAKSATFADAGGDGGSGASQPPKDLNGLRSGNHVDLYWTNDGGTSDNVIFMNGSPIGSVNNDVDYFGYDFSGVGYFEFYVANDDGSTNPYSFYSYGYDVF